MDDFVVGLVMMAGIAAIIGYFFFKARKAESQGMAASSDPGSDGRSWDYSDSDGGSDGGGD